MPKKTVCDTCGWRNKKYDNICKMYGGWDPFTDEFGSKPQEILDGGLCEHYITEEELAKKHVPNYARRFKKQGERCTLGIGYW